MGTLIDLTGQRFGRLTVIERAVNGNDGRSRWLCRCDCGKNCVTSGKYLRNGDTTSCGCYSIECATDRVIKMNTTHRKSKTRLYSVWVAMKKRCYNTKHAYFSRYGGRGITVCDEWLHNFNAFYDWAMKNGYDENAPRGQCTIDRIDNNKGYSPDNCQWVTTTVQNNNVSTNRKYTVDGKTMTLTQWSDEKNICYTTVVNRLRRGWSIEEALELAPRKKS